MLSIDPLPLAAAWASGTAGAAALMFWHRVGGIGIRVLVAVVAAVGIGCVGLVSSDPAPALYASAGLAFLVGTIRKPRVSALGWIVVFAALSPLVVDHGMALVGEGALVGCITVGLCLGHWFLVDPHLPRKPMRLLAIGSLAGLAISAGATLIGPRTESVFGPIVPVVAVAAGTVTAIVLVGVLGALRIPTYKGVQSATGLFYVATMSVSGYVILVASLRIGPTIS